VQLTEDFKLRLSHLAGALAFIFAAIVLLHWPLLHLPYFWDEAGYYVPAARDLFLNGSLIPHSTPSNAHPPLMMAYLALCWKLFGFSPLVTRLAMLLIAAFSLTGLYQLARRVALEEVAIATVACTALYPVFFAQSSLAQVDLAAAGLTFWALSAYVEKKWIACALWFSLTVLAKETAVLAPMALLGWEIAQRVFLARENGIRVSMNKSEKAASIDRGSGLQTDEPRADKSGALAPAVALLTPILPLTLWYFYHYHRTGFVFGNPEFFRYNVAATTNPIRITLAFLLRLWQLFGYMNLAALTAATCYAMLQPAQPESPQNSTLRPRIAIGTQLAFAAVIFAYVLAMSVVGGAVLARYMLPVTPLIILLGVSTLRRRLRRWPLFAAAVAILFIVGLVVNPPYGFSPEDNLAYRDSIELHQHAEQFISTHEPSAHILTAWPANDELTRPYLGYVNAPMKVVRIDDFTAESLLAATDMPETFDVALIFSTKYEPSREWLAGWTRWRDWKTRFFGYHRDVPPEVAAQILGGRIVFEEKRQGQWVSVITVERAVEAQARPRFEIAAF
jgi:4-amino-4-deoxy-L-arabinose transferase-like glycosyltransferase